MPPSPPRSCRGWLVGASLLPVWYGQAKPPGQGTPPPLLRPFRRSLSGRGSLSCLALSPCRVAHRFPHVIGAGRSLDHLRPSRLLRYSVPTVGRKTSPKRAVTSAWITLKYKKTGHIANIRPFKCCFFWINCIYLGYKGTAAALSRVTPGPLNRFHGSPIYVFSASKTSRQTLGRSPLLAAASRFIQYSSLA